MIHPLQDGVTVIMLGQCHSTQHHTRMLSQTGVLTISIQASHIGTHLETTDATGTIRPHPLCLQTIGLQHQINLLGGNLPITTIPLEREGIINTARNNHIIGHRTDPSHMVLTGVVKRVGMDQVGLAVLGGSRDEKLPVNKRLTLGKAQDLMLMVRHMLARSFTLELVRPLRVLVKGNMGKCSINEMTMAQIFQA